MSGRLVAIEGIDGSGKGTQARLLQQALARSGVSADLLAFPRYEQTLFGRTIARYLNGEFGDLQSAGPHFAALLYAGDRFESLPLLVRLRDQHDVVICDRYVPSNLAHQGAKLPPDQIDSFIDWLESVEYGVYQLPRPDLVIWLDMPAEKAVELIGRKPARSYTSRPADLHEADRAYLSRTANIYRRLSRRSNWRTVAGCQAGHLRPPHQVHKEVLGHVERLLASARQ